MNLDVIIENIHEILKEISIQSNNTETLFLRGEFSNYIEKEDYAKIEKVLPNSGPSDFGVINRFDFWLRRRLQR